MTTRTRRDALGLLAAGVGLPFTATRDLAWPQSRQGLLPVYNVKEYGAVGTGKTLDTTAIQKAIDAAGAAGGGVVYFPTGDFLSGTLVLRSYVTLHLSSGAVLRGSDRMEDYSPGHLIYAQGVTNVSIEGGGVIDGQGDSFLGKNFVPLPRPLQLIEIWDSRFVRIQDITIRKAPAWTIHPKNCDDVKIRGVSLLNNLRAVNTDGIDIDSSRNVMISDCYIEGGDDCIVLKTMNQGGSAGPVENVTVANCVLVSSASALKLGTNSYGDFRHCTFSNCVIRDSRTGISLFARDGGVMEDIRFQNITMTTQPKWGQGVEWPIVVDSGKRTADSRVGRIRDVLFSDIRIHGRGRVLVEGMSGSPIEQLVFRNVQMRMSGYESISGVRKMSGGETVAKGGREYGAVAAAMIFAYVKGLWLDGISTHWPAGAEAAERAAIFGDHLEDVLITAFRGSASVAGASPIRIENSEAVRQ